MHLLERWEIDEIKRTANNAAKSYELAAIRSDVDSVERSIRELSACVDGLRSALEATLCRIEQLERLENERSNQ